MGVVQLTRLERKNWAGKAKYDGASDGIGAFITKPHGLPYTGLSNEDAARLESKLRLESGFLSPRSEFWVNYNVSVGADEVLQLDLAEPEDELIYLFLKNHKLVANGYKEKRKNQFVQFVLFNPEEKAKEENDKTDIVAHAYALLYNMSHFEMLDALEVAGFKVKSAHPEVVKQQANVLVKKNPQAFVNMLSDKEYKLKLFVYKCVANGVVTKSKNNVDTAVFYFEEEYLGTGIKEVTNKLQSNSAQGLYIGMHSKLERSIKAQTLATTANATDKVTDKADVVTKTEVPATPIKEEVETPKEYVPLQFNKVEPKTAQAPVDMSPLNLTDLASSRDDLEKEEVEAKPTKPAPRKAPVKKVIKGSKGLNLNTTLKNAALAESQDTKQKIQGGLDSDVPYDEDPTVM